MNLIKALRPRFRVHLRLLALELSDSLVIEEHDHADLQALIAQIGDFMGYEGNWRDWDDQRQHCVLGAVLGGLNDFDFREIKNDTEDDDDE